MKKNRYLFSLIAFSLALLFLPGAVSAAEPDEIRQEIENLRKEFREIKRIREENDNRMKFIEKKLTELTGEKMAAEHEENIPDLQDVSETDFSEIIDSAKLYKDIPEGSPLNLLGVGMRISFFHGLIMDRTKIVQEGRSPIAGSSLTLRDSFLNLKGRCLPGWVLRRKLSLSMVEPVRRLRLSMKSSENSSRRLNRAGK